MVEYKRGKKDRTWISTRVTWESKCGRYRVAEHRSTLGGSVRITYYALVDGQMLEHMRTYRTRKAAEKAIEKYDKHHTATHKS